MSFTSLADAEVDAKSPMDDLLWAKVQDDLDDLDSRVIAAGSSPHHFILNGKLSNLADQYRSVAQAVVMKETQLSQFRACLKKSGTAGLLALDIRKTTSPKTVITAISHQYTAATSSIARKGSSLPTQSISRATSQISTQSITHAKAANNVQSIILLGTVDNLGTNIVQYNLASSIDSDTLVGDSVVFASCTTGANNVTGTILEKNRGGGNNLVISNAAGVAQTGVAGTAQIKIMSYNFTNPVDAYFIAGYSAKFASHTSGNNDGDLTIYAVNSGGNNLWIKNSTGVVQGGAAGTADTNLFKYNMTTSVSTTDYIVGEKALAASHTSPADDGALYITHVNLGGNNVVLHVQGGVTQAGILGSVNTNRWIYNLPTDPTSQVSVSDTMYMSGHTNVLNDGTFTVMAVTASTVVVYNLSGVAQASTPGNVYTTKKLVQFASDQSAVYTTNSFIEMAGCADPLYNYYYTRAPFRVLQVNRGGGSNYNVVIDNPTAPVQSSPAGYVQLEMKSVFNTAPSIAVDVTGLEPNQNLVASSTDFVSSTIAAQTPLLLFITTQMSGDPEDLTVTIL